MRSPFLIACARRASRPLTAIRKAVGEQQAKLRNEVLAVKGLMPLLMKRRNNERWTPEDLELLRQHVKRLSAASPYLAVLLLPGGIFLLPLLAWWLDRRRRNRAANAAAARLPKV